MKEFTDVVLGTATDIAKMVRSLLASRTTWLAVIGFIAVYASSGKIEAFQQLLAYLGIGGVWILKMGVQNVAGIIKGNGLPTPKPEPEATMKVNASDLDTTILHKPLPPVVPEKPFDVKAFHERVLSDVGSKYSEVNPFTVFSEAKDKGSVTTCYGIQQAKDYWDYLVPLAYAARDDVKERTERAKGACKGVAAPELVLMESQLARILQHRDNVYRLSDIPWTSITKSLDVNDTLYKVGVLSEELLRTYWT
jgi:hypothetical protein